MHIISVETISLAFAAALAGVAAHHGATEPKMPAIAAGPSVTQAPTKAKVNFAGYADGYYEHDLGKPAAGETLNGRGLDISNNRLTLSFAEVDASLAPAPFGFNLQLYGGRGPELIHLAEPGGKNKYRWIRTAYVTYVTPGKTPVTIDFGKFDTWIGYEGIDNRYQDEYSRSFNWTYSEPTYETGLRATAKLSDKLSGALYIVQGWNEVEDPNDGRSAGLALTYTPDAKTTLTLQNHFGVEGSKTPNDVGSYGGIAFANPGTSFVHLVDFIASYQITPATKVAFNVDYANSDKAPNRGKWNGEVLYLRHQLKPNQAIGVRLDRMEDTDGLRTGSPVLFHSLSGTYDYTINNNFTLRFEVRRDFASHSFFNSDNGPKKERTTLTAALIAKF